MLAQQPMRQTLDERTGTECDGTKNPIHYTDPKVCRCFLLGLCPHEALAGTKMALGECRKIHDYALKADFKNSSRTCRSNRHLFYELTVLTYLRKVIRFCEIIDRTKNGRLSQSQAETGRAAAAEKQAELERYSNMVDKKIAEAEQLGSFGMVEESIILIREIERLKTRHTRQEKYHFRNSSEPVKEEKRTICEECQLLDNSEQRMANHSNGRLHHGMLAMRRKITDLSAKLQAVKLRRDCARLNVQQQMRMSSNPALVSTRTRSCSPYSVSSSRSRTTSRYTSHSRSRRSYSMARSLTRRSYTKNSYTNSSLVTRNRPESHQGISRQQCISVRDDAKSCSLSVSTRDESKNLLDGTGKSARPNEKRHAKTQNTAWHIASSIAGRCLKNSTHKRHCTGKPRPESELDDLPGENLGKRYTSVSFAKHSLRPKSDTRSRRNSSRSKSRSRGRKHSASRCSKKEKVRTTTKVDARDREDKSEDENSRGLTARAEHEGQVDPKPTPDSKNRIKETRGKDGRGDLKTGRHVSSSSPVPDFKKREMIKRKYRSGGRRSESYEESSKSSLCSQERYSRRGAKVFGLRKRKTKRRKRRHSSSSSESPARRKPSKKKLARRAVTQKRKLSSKSKTRTKSVRKKLKKKMSVSPSRSLSLSSESSSLSTDTDSHEEQKSRRKRGYRSKPKLVRRTSERKQKGNERTEKGSRHRKRRKL